MLVVDSDGDTWARLLGPMGGRGFRVERAGDAQDALLRIDRAPPDVLLFDVAPERAEEMTDLVDRAREVSRGVVLVVVTPPGETDLVEQAARHGVDHCLTRPLSVERLAVVVDGALAGTGGASAAHAQAEALEADGLLPVVASHPAMQRLMQRVTQAARSKATILIEGETGTGKEMIAAAIHARSNRSKGPFVRVNCAALSETLLESELFGHERGAFTGAIARRKGRFELAHGGTLFLDEVSEISPPVQVKLLRFLQERELERVGSSETLRVDVRVVAATNRDLRACVDEGTFREDLYYRLNVVRLDVPPLRARTTDIPALARHFLALFATENEKDVHDFGDGAMRALIAHPWPGNVRELQNAVEQAVVLTAGQMIEESDLPITQRRDEVETLRLMIPGVTLAELERYAILKTLEAVGGSTSRAGVLLGISRRTIQYRLHQWGLTGYARSDGGRGPEDGSGLGGADDGGEDGPSEEDGVPGDAPPEAGPGPGDGVPEVPPGEEPRGDGASVLRSPP